MVQNGKEFFITQWSNLIRTIVITVGLILIGWMLYTFRPLISPLVIAALLAYTLNPLVDVVLRHSRLNRKWAVPLVYLVGLTVTVTIISVLAPVVVERLNSFLAGLVNAETQLEALLDEPIMFAGQELRLGPIVADLLSVTGESLTSIAEGTRTVLEVTSISLLWLLIVLVSAYYFLLDGEKLFGWLVRLAPDSAQADIRRLLDEIDIIWRAYLRGTFALMIIIGVIFTVILLIIGLPGAIVVGVLTGLLSIIPDVGPAIAAFLAVLVAYFQGSDVLPISNIWFAVLISAIYFVLIQVKAVWLRSRVMKHFLHMNEGLIFVAIIGATMAWGILGALIIVPLLATIGKIGRYVRCRLLYLDPWPEEDLAVAGEEKRKEDVADPEEPKPIRIAPSPEGDATEGLISRFLVSVLFVLAYLAAVGYSLWGRLTRWLRRKHN